MKDKMSRWGVGPVFAVLSISCAIIIFAISFYFHPAFQINWIPHWILMIAGIALLIIGVPFYIVSAKSVTRAYNADALVTDGIFRRCRHPLYSSWVVFIAPGIAFLAGSWIVFTIPIFMYMILRKLVRKEEAHLENVFGSEYIEYKKRVPCIFPIGR